MSCRKRKLNCLKVNWFYWLLFIETTRCLYCIKVPGHSKDRSAHLLTNPHTSLSHQEWHPAKETDESNQRNVLVELGVELLFCLFYNRLLAGYSWLRGATPRGLASLTAGSDNNQPFRILAFIASSGAPKSLLHIAYSFPLFNSTCFHAIAEDLYSFLTFSLLSSIHSSQAGLALWGHLYWFMRK